MSETVASAVPLISAAEARERVAPGAVLVDVRSPEGRARAGVIAEALIANKGNLAEEFDLSSDQHHAEVSSAQTPIVVVCGSVAGSGPAAEVLAGQGFVNVVHVEGGAAAWFAAGDDRPVE